MAFEEKYIKKLVTAFQRIENEILKYIQILNTAEEVSIQFYNSIRSEISKQYEKFRVVTRKWDKYIPISYNQNIRNQVSKIKNLKYRPPKITKSSIIIDSNINKAVKNNLVNDFNATMFTGLDMGQRTVNNLINLTQQIRVEEKAIQQAIKESAGKSTFQVKKQIQNSLMKKVLDKKYITIVDKNGKLEQWQTSKYADMVARTKLSEAQGLSTTNTALAFGSDLIQVSDHNTTTPICIPFEGKIFSISGRDKDFPPLVELNPFHPNCLHTTTVIFREILEGRGIKKYSDFSLGKTQVHPTRKSHVPYSQRQGVNQNQVKDQFNKVGL